MNKNKQLVVNMVAQTVSTVLGFCISFFLTPYVVKHIGVDAYGFVGLSNSFINYVTIITTALNSMASRFITIAIHRGERENVNGYFSSVIAANVLLAVPITVLAAIVLVKLNAFVEISVVLLPDVRLLWAFLFANFILSLVGNVFNVATFSENRLDLSARRNMESQLLRVAILLLAFCLFRPKVWYIGFAAIVCGIYILTTNVYYTKKFLPYVKFRKNYFDLGKIKTLISSGIWNSISQLSSVLTTGLDLLVSNWFVGANAMGIVSVSKQVPVYIRTLFGTFGSVFAPNITISFAKNDYRDIAEQMNSAVRLLGFFACIPIAFIFVYSREFYMLWVPEQNAGLLQILSIMEALEMPMGLALEPLYYIFTATDKVKISSWSLIISSCLSISLTFVALIFTTSETLKLCMIVGISSAIAIIRVSTFLPIYAAKCIKQKWSTFYPVMGKILLSNIITILLSFGMKFFLQIDSWFLLIFAVGITTMIAIVINYFFMLNGKERTILKEKLKNILQRGKRNDS